MEMTDFLTFTAVPDSGFVTDGIQEVSVVRRGVVVWRGTVEMFGLLLASMTQDLHREWRCNTVDATGGGWDCNPDNPRGYGACTDKCGWIVWFFEETVL